MRLGSVLHSLRMSEPRPPGLPFVVSVRVRYADTDAEGVVYYGSYLTYFEVARVELLRALGCPVAEVRRRGVVLPAVHAECRYLRPARVDDLLEVRMWLLPMKRATIGFVYEVWRDNELLAEGSTLHATVDARTGKVVRRPSWLNELVELAPGVIGSAAAPPRQRGTPRRSLDCRRAARG